jgi:beta-xylosidase
MLARFLDRYEQKNVGGTGSCPISMTARVNPLQLPCRIIDVGDLYRLLREDARAQLVQAQREIGFSYIRFSGLFIPCSGMEIFGKLDRFELFDLFADCGLNPFVQVDAADDTASLINILDTFREYCKTADHAQWKFELPGNVKNSDWLKEAAKAIRSACPDAAVGLRVDPACLPKPGKQGAAAFWRLTADFFTIESDPNQTAVGTFFDERDQKRYHRNMLQYLREWMKAQGITAPVYLTGWNTLTGRSIAEAGEFHRSALIADTILSLREELAGITFPLNLQQIESVQPDLPTYPLSLFLYRDIRRPLFFVLRSLCSLGPLALYESDGILVTRCGDDSYALLLWHPCYINPFESLDNMRQDDYKKDVQLTLEQLHPGKYRIKSLYLNRDNGSIYSSWMRVGILAPMDQDVLDCMRHFSSPWATLDEQIVTDHISVHQPLSLNAVALWRIWRIPDEDRDRDDGCR